MKDKVVSMAIKADNNKLWTVEQMLLERLETIAKGKIVTRAMVITLDDNDGEYNLSYMSSNISISQMVAMLEVLKNQLVREMHER